MSPRTRRNLGLLVALGGVAMVVVGMFLPLSSVNDLGELARNRLADRNDAIWIYAMSGLTLVASVRFAFFPTRDSAIATIFSGAVLLCLVGLSTSTFDVYQLHAVGPGPREYVSLEDKANWGIGPILGVLGSLAAVLGGCLQFRGRDLVKSEKEIAQRKANEDAPLPEAKVAIPRFFWTLLYVVAWAVALVPIGVVSWNLPPLGSTLEFALMVVFICYFAGVGSVIRRCMKEEVVPYDAPNAPPRPSGEAADDTRL